MSNFGGAKINLLQNIEQLVQAGYCVGCGLCVAMCPDGSSRMILNQYGAYEPEFGAGCSDCLKCMRVCPFSDGVIEGITNPNEDELGKALYAESGAIHDQYIGYHLACYAGYAQDFRANGTSGGITTWILAHLLETGRVDKVICVGTGSSDGPFFEYKVCKTVEEVRSAAKSRYYPVHLAAVIKEVLENEGRYAVVALPCIVKAIRYAQAENEIMQERIVFCAGLFCGGLRTAHFTEFLAAQLGVNKEEIKNPQYRIKHETSTSHEFYFGCSDPSAPSKNLEFIIRRIRDIWGRGYFKPKVCDYCDDVTADLADFSAGDAWVEPYSSDWRGTNVIITRSKLAQAMVEEGLVANSLKIERISHEVVYKSQKSNFENRRKGLSFRLYWASSLPVPRKRVKPIAPRNFVQAKVYRQRMRLRAKCQEAWLLQRDKMGTRIFDGLMRKDLNNLRIWHYIYRFVRKLIKT